MISEKLLNLVCVPIIAASLFLAQSDNQNSNDNWNPYESLNKLPPPDYYYDQPLYPYYDYPFSQDYYPYYYQNYPYYHYYHHFHGHPFYHNYQHRFNMHRGGTHGGFHGGHPGGHGGHGGHPGGHGGGAHHR
jgi:hypothetical protein